MFQSLNIHDSFRSSPLAILFPPVTSRGRFLIHKTVEEFFPELGSVSIGEGLDRRTLVTWSQLILKQEERNKIEAKNKSTDSKETSTKCPNENPKMAEVKLHNLSGHEQERTNRRELRQAVPIYRPPGARMSQPSCSKDSVDDIHKSMRNRLQKTMEQNTNNARTNKRPDRQLYVPRGRRSNGMSASPFDENFPTRPASPANSICSVVSEFSGRNRYDHPHYNNQNPRINEEWPSKVESRPQSRNGSSYLIERCLNQKEDSQYQADREFNEYKKGSQNHRNSHHKENFQHPAERMSPKGRNGQFTPSRGPSPNLSRTNSWNNLTQTSPKRNYRNSPRKRDNRRQNWEPRRSYTPQKNFWQHEYREPGPSTYDNSYVPRSLPISPQKEYSPRKPPNGLSRNVMEYSSPSSSFNIPSPLQASTPNRSYDSPTHPYVSPMNITPNKSPSRNITASDASSDFCDAVEELNTQNTISSHDSSEDTSLSKDSFDDASSSSIIEREEPESTTEKDPVDQAPSLEESTPPKEDSQSEMLVTPLPNESPSESSEHSAPEETVLDSTPSLTKEEPSTSSEIVPASSPEKEEKPVEKVEEKPRLLWSDCIDDWDQMYDDAGKCVAVVEEVKKVVKTKVSIKEPVNNYKEFSPDDSVIETRYNNVVEIYDFHSSFTTKDMLSIFKEFRNMDIRWVDETHALGIFETEQAASALLDFKHPFVKTRPLNQGTAQSKAKARRSTEGLLPHKARPQTSATLARRLVGSALGLKVNVPKEVRDAEKQKIKDAKETRRRVAKQKSDAWEGTTPNLAKE